MMGQSVDRRQLLQIGAGATLGLAVPRIARAQSSKTITAVMHAPLRATDPIMTTAWTARNHGYMIYDTLFSTNSKFEIKPQMVEAWEVSADKLTYTFRLRPGLKFHDGVPVTSADVIHSWWVPAFAVRRDAIPGFVNEAWTRIEKPGIYRGQCAELCGKDHGFMPIVVEVKSKADYDTWLGERKAEAAKLKELTSKEWTLEELVARGDKVYHTTCVACHQAEGQGLPPMFPALKGSPIATGAKEDHLHRVYFGKPGTAMAAFGKQLSEVDIAAVVTYERNAWGNNKGDMVTPKDVLAIKQAESK